MCGISPEDKIFAISADIARQAGWLQLLLHSENVPPEEQDDIARCELFQNQMMCKYLTSKSPENEFRSLLQELGSAFEAKTGVKLWKDFDSANNIVSSVSRFLSLDEEGFVRLAKKLTSAMIERIDAGELKNYINNRVDTKQLKSIGLLSASLTLLGVKCDAGQLVKFMRDINDVRQIDAHLMSNEDVAAKRMRVPVPENLHFLEQGARLIEYANDGIEKSYRC